jgi:hypothetical protein
MQHSPFDVIPAKAGIQKPIGWTPAFAGVTSGGALCHGAAISIRGSLYQVQEG